MSHSKNYFNEAESICKLIDYEKIDFLAESIKQIKENQGRVFILGVGGSAGNASHMTNDLRKLCCIEAYCPTDNVSELTARTNDEGFDTIFSEYLKVSRLNERDCIFILSVGGGNKEKNVSAGLINAIDYAKLCKSKIFGIVGKEDGYTYLNGNCVISVPSVAKERITPHSEAFQAMIWHCLVSNSTLQKNSTKW